jgi:uncharacterized RDD family membrane protein YckC
MTQQDETSQSAATDQSVPPRPSPYLDAGESAPQAYLAPPQPDQPRYGMPPPFRGRLRSGPPGTDPYAQRGYGQRPGYSQPGYGQAPNRPIRGSGSRRDPSIAAPWERLGASFVDWIIIWAASVLPYWTSLIRIGRELQAIMVSAQDQSSPAAQAAIYNLLGQPSTQHVLVYWSLTVFGLALVYYWVQHALWGATIGKRVFGLRVVQSGDQGRIGVKAAGIRTIAFLVGPALLWFLAPPLNVAGGVLWVADAGLAIVEPQGRCLHDRLAGTIVIRRRWLNKQASSASPW